MSNAAFTTGFEASRADRIARRERKQQLTDEERQTHVANLYDAGHRLSSLIPTLSGDERDKAMQQLVNVEQQISDAYHPIKSPGALQKDWSWLKSLITRKPPPTPLNVNYDPTRTPDLKLAASPESFTVSGEPASTTTAPGRDAKSGLLSKAVKTAEAPGLAETSFSVSSAPPVLPGHTIDVRPAAEAMTSEQRQRMQQRDDARKAAEIDVAAGAEPNKFTQYHKTLTDAGFTEDQADRALRVVAGIEAKPVDRHGYKTSDFEAGFDRYLREKGIDPEDATAEDERDYRSLIHPHAPSMYQSQRTSFAQSLGKKPDELTWEDEQTFLTQRYGASQPYAQKRVELAEEHARIDEANLALRRSENNMKDYFAIQKSLSPFEKVETASSRVDEYASNPSGPGDVALTFAFIEAVKPSSGFRFTETERKWILGSRGFFDGIDQRMDQVATGETLSADQRQHMSTIIKQAAAQADEKRDRMVSGAGSINPTATAAATGTTAASPGTSKSKKSTGAPRMFKEGAKIYTIQPGDVQEFQHDHPNAKEVVKQ